MQKITKNAARFTLIAITAAIVFASCKKSDSVSPLNTQGQATVAPVFANDTVFGNYGNPASGPSAFGTVYWNLSTGVSYSTPPSVYHVLFTSTNNLNMGPASGYTLKYYNTTTPLGNLDMSDYADSATTVTTSLGLNSASDSTNSSLNANGWLNYDITTHQVVATHNVVLFLSTGSAVYAFQCTKAIGQGTDTSNRGVYVFSRGTVIN